MSLREIYSVKYEPFFDTKTGKYINIITISQDPKGPLSSLVRRVYREKLSDKEVIESEDKCSFSIMSARNTERYMNLNELPMLYAFLKNNKYDINHIDLKWEDRTICFIEYFI
jgi:hypothetical protein